MGKEDYAASSGGALKLKGAKNAGVDKNRKKKPKSKAVEEAKDVEQGSDKNDSNGINGTSKALAEEDADLTAAGDNTAPYGAGKTEAERRHEEMRRRRLDERLKREGVKTHKERVEELNKYLSTLSEHHDMPRIGPG